MAGSPFQSRSFTGYPRSNRPRLWNQNTALQTEESFK